MNATLFICDDLRLEITGKLILIGVYPGHLSIPVEESRIAQLTFVFSVDCPIEVTPNRIMFEVTLPGEEPSRGEVEVQRTAQDPQHTRWTMKHAMVAVGPVLRPGKITARVVVDGVKETPVAGAWIVVAPPVALPVSAPSPNAEPPPPVQSQSGTRKKAKKP